MRLSVDFSALKQLVSKMGAEVRTFDFEPVVLGDLGDLAIKLEVGLEVDINDVEINASGLLAYQGHQVVLYIPDQGRRLSQVLLDGEMGKRFHVSDCDTLNKMKSWGRFERYVVRNGLSPDFSVHGHLDTGEFVEKAEAQLKVCKNCLKRLNYQGYLTKGGQAKKDVFERFDQGGFFATYSSYFEHLPRQSADTAKPNVYVADWRDISHRTRELADWTCQSCAVRLNGHRKLLHAHHVNGNKSDNTPNNLKVLCADCHSKEVHHEWLFVRQSDRQLIQRLRREQQVYTPPRPGSRTGTDWGAAFQDADPAVHGLLDMLRHKGFTVPEVGLDIMDQDGEVIYSSTELAWPDKRMVVVLREDPASKRLEGLGWKVFTAQQTLESLLR